MASTTTDERTPPPDANNHDNNNAQVAHSEKSGGVLIPRICLLFVPILGSFDTTMSRAAFTLYDRETEITISPFSLAVCRTVLASIMFTILLKLPWLVSPSLSKLPSPEGIPPSVLDRIKAAGLGILAVTINLICFLVGVQWTSAITVAAMQCTVAPLCFLIGWSLGIEAFTFAKALCTLFVVAGNFLLSHLWRLFTGEYDDNHHTPRYYFGVLLVFGNAVSFAAYLVLQKPLLKKFAFVDFMWHVQFFGMIGLLIVSLCFTEPVVTGEILSGKLSKWSWATIFYTGCVHSVVTYLFLAYGIERCGSPLLAALFFSLRPFLVTIEAILLLDEKLSDMWQVLGGSFVVVGLVFSVVANVLAAREADAIKNAGAKKKENEAGTVGVDVAADVPKTDDDDGSGDNTNDVPSSPHVRTTVKI